MATNLFEVRIKGKTCFVPSGQIEGSTTVVHGKWLKIASVHDEEWLEGPLVKDPGKHVSEMRRLKLKADLFTFAQRIPDCRPKYAYRHEMDNVAALPITTFAEWWEKRLPQESRKNVRRAGRRGVTVRTVPLDDRLVEGITEIYNETPVRQGVPFGHYGKNFATVKKEVSTLMDHCEFLGAYLGEELIGFVKLAYLGPVASILHIVSKEQHYDKRPTNALLAKAVEVCCERGKSFLIYGKYIYGNKTGSSLTEFKHRNGFEQMLFPRYYIPLTLKGRICLRLGFHRGLLGNLPPSLIALLLRARSWFVSLAVRSAKPKPPLSINPAEDQLAAGQTRQPQ